MSSSGAFRVARPGIGYGSRWPVGMTGTPDSLTVLPARAEGPPIDRLLDLLRAMDLTGAVFLEAEFTSPWCVVTNVRPQDRAAFLSGSGHVIAYHYVMEGRCTVAADGDGAHEVRAGEIVLLP